MSTIIEYNGEVREIDIFDLLPPDEGEIAIYYGRMGTGKTTRGTINIIQELKRGLVVYANWKIDWSGYDETKNKFLLLAGLFGLKRTFYNFPKENFHFWDLTNNTIDGRPCADFVTQLSKLTDCSVHLDEGHIPFDSYEATRMEQSKRSAVFAMRHYDRKLTVYTQRANSVHVNLRGNTNRFYKCEKLHDFTLFKHRFIKFIVTEFQDLTSSGAVDETLLIDPETGLEIPYAYKKMINQETYWGKKKIFEMFNTKYLRTSLQHSQPNFANAVRLRYEQMWRKFFGMTELPLDRISPPLPPLQEK